MRASEGYSVATFAERPDLIKAAVDLASRNWPAFVLHEQVSARLTPRLASDLADYQLFLLDPEGELLGVGVSVPLRREPGGDPPAGWDAAFEQAVADLDAGREPTIVCALSATLAPGATGRGLSQLIIQAMRDLAHTHRLHELIAPVRPTYKARYPLTPMERYVRWTTPGGAPFDPWIRTHWRGGAEIVAVAPESMLVTGTVAEWEAWTGMRFPDSGPYVIPGGLVPLTIDTRRDQGIYVEPNVWMRHAVGTPWAGRPDPGSPSA